MSRAVPGGTGGNGYVRCVEHDNHHGLSFSCHSADFKAVNDIRQIVGENLNTPPSGTGKTGENTENEGCVEARLD